MRIADLERVQSRKIRGLCLGGGGMRAFSILGFMQRAEEVLFECRVRGFDRGFEFDRYKGASAGSFLCLLLASGCSVPELTSLARDQELRKKLFRPSLSGLTGDATGMIDGQELDRFLTQKLFEKGILSEPGARITFARFKALTGKSMAFAVTFLSEESVELGIPEIECRLVGMDPGDQEEDLVQTCIDSMRICPFLSPRYDPRNKRFCLDGGFFMNFPLGPEDRDWLGIRMVTNAALEGMEKLRDLHEGNAYARRPGTLGVKDQLGSLLFAFTQFVEEKDPYPPWAIGIPVSQKYLTEFYIEGEKVDRIILSGREAFQELIDRVLLTNYLLAHPEALRKAKTD